MEKPIISAQPVAKGRPGRPSVDPLNRQSVVVGVSMSRVLADRVREVAGSHGKPVAAFCRDAIERAVLG